MTAPRNTEQHIRGAVADTLDGRENVTLIEVTIERSNEYMLFSQPQRVVVTVGSPPGEHPGDLVRLLDERIDAAIGRDVRVQVRYVEVRSASSYAEPGETDPTVAGPGVPSPPSEPTGAPLAAASLSAGGAW